MKRYLPYLLLLLLVPAVVIVPKPMRDLQPLEELEQRARQIPAIHTIYMAPLDDRFQMQALQVQNIVEFVMGTEVNYITMEDEGVSGWTALNPHSARAINIDEHLKWTARLEVMGHEAGHRLQPPSIHPTSSESEVFAEAVSFLVCRAYGHDSMDAVAHYLAIHKGGLHVLQDYRMEIDYAVMVLSGKASK